MNEHELALVDVLRHTERKLAKLETKVDILAELVAKEELYQETFNREYNSSGSASLKCDLINAIFGWANVAKEAPDETEG